MIVALEITKRVPMRRTPFLGTYLALILPEDIHDHINNVVIGIIER